ncbi:HEXXH motif domain-containing protein [Dactylosporangium matsuzakiense]|uniref:HEXXH motif domain-containing protein n=1 Tax=Dactylosporangium matsuzakiense TaxID=53360 RepID=A0A9W6NPW9_9ACTN|nr:HEXXH motif domain-containing protein [Dactylosporangium matsuzakiense]UWZ44638.1 hypothetical protein Dmats_46115 [Dactylosporangium matsuzakiense]GLL04646.1 HEXXH motif domain-containing protein [Dactylosporangium matsuzakiense]
MDIELPLTELSDGGLPEADFDDFAAGFGTPGGIRALRSGQIVRRSLMLREVLARARSSRLDAAYEVLVAAEAEDRDTFTRTLAAPHFGAWATTALRNGGEHVEGLLPIVAAAAIGAGLDFTLDVPVSARGVVLPGLGRAASAEPRVAVFGKAGEFRVGDVPLPADPGSDGPGWTGLRRLRSTVDGCTIQVSLDDLDPYRDTHRLSAADRLDAGEAQRWQQVLDDAWRILVRHHRRYADAIAAGLVTIVPLTAPEAGHSINATSMDAFGSVSLSPPKDGLGLAASVLHEFQHAKLGALLNLRPLYHDEGVRELYAPWRDDPRPLGGVLQGVYAFLGVTDFWRIQRHVLVGGKAQFADFEFARWRERVWRTFLMLESSDRFNAAGRRFLAAMRATQEAWLQDTVPVEAVALAAEAAEDHQAGWRLRNRRPDPAQMRAIAEAWVAGSAVPPITVETTVVPGDVRALARNHRLDLTVLRLSDPERFEGTCAQPVEQLRASPEAATTADIAYARGDFEAAVRDYTAQIASDAENRAAWVGLALAARRGTSPDAALWRDRPELPYAVHLAVRQVGGPGPDPVALARWLSESQQD